jgi:hypothetical protein
LKSWAFSIIVLPLSMFLLLIGRIEPHFCDVPLPFPPHFVLYLIMFLQILHCRLSGWAVIFFSIWDCSSCFSMIGIWGDSWYCPCTLISCTTHSHRVRGRSPEPRTRYVDPNRGTGTRWVDVPFLDGSRLRLDEKLEAR